MSTFYINLKRAVSIFYPEIFSFIAIWHLVYSIGTREVILNENKQLKYDKKIAETYLMECAARRR